MSSILQLSIQSVMLELVGKVCSSAISSPIQPA
jgi:hypothetical protein